MRRTGLTYDKESDKVSASNSGKRVINFEAQNKRCVDDMTRNIKRLRG